MPTQIQNVLKEQAETAQRNIEILEAELTRLQVNPLVSPAFYRSCSSDRQLISNLMSAIAIAR